ncbi:MAG: hypothetical protein HUU20_06940 [Pirellulales bacterium]|nr:hypothetical protein [Pirellulales bacterium]
MSARTITTLTAAAVSATLLLHPSGRAFGQGQKISRQGVTAWVPAAKTPVAPEALNAAEWEAVAADRLPLVLQREAWLGTETMLCALEPGGAKVAVFTRRAERLVLRASIHAGPAGTGVQYRLVDNGSRGGLGVEVSRDGVVQYTLRALPSGLIELMPGKSGLLEFSGCRLSYALVPSLIGTDLLYAPAAFPGKQRLCLPPMNLLVGLVEGGDCTMAAAWPPGDQTVQLGLADQESPRSFDRLAVAPAGRSVYLQFVEQPGIWHAEPLKPAYLEKDAVIAWKRPFEAKWIGYFFVESEDIGYPYYFLNEKRKLWGRYMRSWYEYPVWFDGARTCLHFEKKSPPRGDLLIYCLEKHRRDAGPASPVEVLEEALGKEEAAGLLDFAGIEERPLLAHREAVCAMTNKMQEFFNAGIEVKQKAFIAQRCGDVADFIAMIRRRVEEYGQFGREMQQLLHDRGQVLSEDARGDLESIAGEIEQAAREDLPKVSLEEVRGWTNQMKQLAREVRPSNSQQYEKLAQQCRSVAGSQDELARELSIRAIRLMETAAAVGVDSPEQARLVARIVADCRRILRHPTWWEPRRYCEPKSNPGAP